MILVHLFKMLFELVVQSVIFCVWVLLLSYYVCELHPGGDMELPVSSFFIDIFHNTSYTTIYPSHLGEHVTYFQV